MDFPTNFPATFHDAFEFLGTLLVINGTVVVYYWILLLFNDPYADSLRSQIEKTHRFFHEVLCSAWTFYALALLLYVLAYRVALFLGG